MLAIIMTVLPPRQPCQSLGGSLMHQGLDSTFGCSLFGHLETCLEQNLQLLTGLPGIFSEIALSDKGGESLDKEPNFSTQGTVPPGTKRFHYDFIDYMLLKMY